MLKAVPGCAAISTLVRLKRGRRQLRSVPDYARFVLFDNPMANSRAFAGHNFEATRQLWLRMCTH